MPYYYAIVDQDCHVRPEFNDPVAHFSKCIDHVLKLAPSPLFVALSPECCGGWHNVMPFLHAIDRLVTPTFVALLEHPDAARLRAWPRRSSSHPNEPRRWPRRPAC